MADKTHSPEETWKRKDDRRPAAEIVAELARLAEQIGRGQVTVGDATIWIGDSLACSIRKQVKKGMFACEIVLRGLPADDTGEAPPGGSGSPRPAMARKSAPPGGKRLKKDIARLWKAVLRQVERDAPPRDGDGAELLRVCEEYSLFADKEWFEPWRRCCDELRACLAAAGRGDHATAREKAALVNRLTKECHSLYK